MLPDRNLLGQIEAIQVRLDKVYNQKFYNLTSVDQYYGTQSKCCPHYVGVHEGDEVVCLTEGVMKSDLAYSFAEGSPYVVLSGSMEPTYHTGSLLYVKSVDPQDLRVGDPITFMLNEDTVATHRIIEILPDEEDSSVLRFRTQGDANDAPDGTPVHYKNVIGKPVFSVPYLGYFANFVQNPPGLYFAIGFAVVLVLLVFLPDLLDDSGKKGKGKGAGEDPTAHN